MLPVLSLCILALAVSLDGFGVGAMYGFRKIRIPILSIVIISLCSGIIILASMQIGVLLSQWLSPFMAKMIGACILIGIGIWAIIQITLQKNGDQEQVSVFIEPAGLEPDLIKKKKKTIIHIELKKLGLVIQILRTPSAADVDRSGTISASEAAVLGIALSLDAFGAGIGAALIGFSPMLTSTVIAAASGFFIAMGLRIGYILSEIRWVNRITVLPGCILILMGILKML